MLAREYLDYSRKLQVGSEWQRTTLFSQVFILMTTMMKMAITETAVEGNELCSESHSHEFKVTKQAYSTPCKTSKTSPRNHSTILLGEMIRFSQLASGKSINVRSVCIWLWNTWNRKIKTNCTGVLYLNTQKVMLFYYQSNIKCIQQSLNKL